jgi:hypothetical protein
MRLYRLGRGEIAAMVLASKSIAKDPQGRPIYEGRTGDGRRVYVVMALDAPNFVVTVFGELP